MQYYRFAKGEIRTAQHEACKSERARHRFEFKQARMAREEAEKEAKRQQRAQAAQKAAAARAEHRDCRRYDVHSECRRSVGAGSGDGPQGLQDGTRRGQHRPQEGREGAQGGSGQWREQRQ